MCRKRKKHNNVNLNRNESENECLQNEANFKQKKNVLNRH